MGQLTSEQRNYYYVLEAERAGIHKSLLAALYDVHQAPPLGDGETGLGIGETNEVKRENINSFRQQVQYAANTIRGVTDALIRNGWQSAALWDAAKGLYTEDFVMVVASGYIPTQQELGMAVLQPCDRAKLYEAYLEDAQISYNKTGLSGNFADLDPKLLVITERVPQYYLGLSHQREALLELVRIWRKLDTHDDVIRSLFDNHELDVAQIDDRPLDQLLEHFAARISPYYAGYPHQREALIRFVQLWRRLDSREDAIASVQQNTDLDLESLKLLDPTLVSFIKRLPKYYTGAGSQRNALTELVRLWRNLDSRRAALISLGIEPQQLDAKVENTETLANLAKQIDMKLTKLLRELPENYQETPTQREAIIRLVQLWRELPTRESAIASLEEDLKTLENEPQPTLDQPRPIILPSRPNRWTPDNLQLATPIIPGGNFTWAEATQGGTRMPPNQETIDAIVRIAQLAQQARDRIGYPFIITSWYRPPHINRAVGGVSNSRHIVGDAIDFVCANFSGKQLYWMLDPWWTGGLGRYSKYPHLCHLDARGYRARWQS